MISIQNFMLVALGFLFAALIVSLVAPAYRRRAVRLTTEAIKRSMPLTEAEIRADKDRLRAEYAITIHRLEMKLDEANLSAARQLVEINRRDASISRLEGEIGKLATTLEEFENARRVLEQTVADRLPKVESRLSEAKKMLFQRDREISSLSQAAQKHQSALDEVTQISTQQRDEIHRLNAALATRAARNRESIGDTRFDGEVALRSEIEALRAKTRDQASQIGKLQSQLARRGGVPGETSDKAEAKAAAVADTGEIARLTAALAEAESRLALSGNAGEATAALEKQIAALKSARDDQAAELARLKAALAAYENAEQRSDKDASDRMTLKAEVASLKAEKAEQTQTIERLRAEVAAANERMARQSSHFRDEMRRLGVGTLPVSSDARKTSPAGEPAERRSLSSRIAEPRVPRITPATEPDAEGERPLAALIDNATPVAANDQTTAARVAGPPKPERDRRPRLMERITGSDQS